MAGAGCSVPVRQHGHMHQNGGSPGPPGPFLLILTTIRVVQGPATLNLQFLLVVPARCCHCPTSHQSSSAKASTALGSVLNFVFFCGWSAQLCLPFSAWCPPCCLASAKGCRSRRGGVEGIRASRLPSVQRGWQPGLKQRYVVVRLQPSWHKEFTFFWQGKKKKKRY